MLSVAKLRVGQEAYQLSGVAQSLDDYYTGVGEAAGQWLGVGAARLGLVGDVAPDDLRAVLAGIAPGSGGLSPNGETIRPHPRRVPGFDLTFKAPKSVSVLYAVSDDPRVQGAIIEAGETALRDTIAWLEREAIRVRRGTANEAFLTDLAARDPEAAAAARIRVLPARGLVAAGFRHRTSRAGDPLLHWHTLVANLVEGPDGRWSAFVHPELYRAVRTAGEVFQTVLRAELTDRLGVEWRPGRHVPEIAGVPQALCDRFSKRSTEIADWLAATGTPDTVQGRQAAVLATRQGKPEVEHERFDAAWKAEAAAAGWGPEQADALIAAAAGTTAGFEETWRLPERVPTADGGSVVAERVVDPEAWIRELGRSLTETDSTFTRPELVQAVAARLGRGATMATVERVVARTLASAQIVPIAGTGDRWTTDELLQIERRFLTTARAATGARAPVPASVVDAVLAERVSLGPDQVEAVRALTETGDGVTVLVGPAGTGKTYTLDAVRAVYEQARFVPRGVAPSARAAHELQADAHIPSSTIHRLLGTWSRAFDLPDERTVLVVDEAAMAGIRDLEAVVTATVAAGGRVVLVGDHHQLPEIGAGGGFAALAADRELTVAELVINRRQHHQWERTALTQLRAGHVPAAVAAYRDHGRVVAAPDRAAMLTTAVDRWFTAFQQGRSPVLIAGTNDTVDALNHTARRLLRTHGLLGESVGTWAGRNLAVGDRVVLRINDYTTVTTTGRSTSVLNGQAATLVAATEHGVVVRLDHDASHVALPPKYLEAGGVDYGYALTAHRAQGGTWDLAIAVGVDGLYREAGYLLLSRGRAENWLVLTTPELEHLTGDLARHDSPIPLLVEEPDDLDTDLRRRLTVSRAKSLALTRDPHADTINQLTTTHDLATLEALADRAAEVEHRATSLVGIDPRVAAERVERAWYTATHAAVGHTVKALDRNNIGTITALHDDTGTVQVTFTSASGHTAVRDLPWAQVQILEPRQPGPRALTPEAHALIELTLAPDLARIERWHQVLAAQGQGPDNRHRYQAAARVAVDRAAARVAAVQPDWLIHLLGQRPPAPAPAQVWDDTVRSIAAHRARHHLTDPHHPLGPRPPDPGPATAWDHIHQTVTEARIWLATHTTRPRVAVTRTRSRVELTDRLTELDAIFATAPDDQRALTDTLGNGGQLPFDDLADVLAAALAEQGERRRWILEHWPHVVERAQIGHTLDRHNAGPDADVVLDHLANTSHPQLADAARHREPWLHHLACQLLPGDDTSSRSGDPVTLLADVAAYRQRWQITGPDPLGDGARSSEQATERTLLTLALERAIHERQHSALDLTADTFTPTTVHQPDLF